MSSTSAADHRTLPTADRIRLDARHQSPTALLRAGPCAGLLFFAVAAVLAVARDGFDPLQHPISALSLGPGGGIQIASFITTGLLTVAAAVGLRRASPASRPMRRGTALIALYGLGFIVAGIFTTDPADGFPLGTLDDPAAPLTWHAQVHAAASTISVLAIVAAMLLTARTLGDRLGPRARSLTRTTAAACIVLAALPTQAGFGLRIALATALAFAWIAGLCVRTARSDLDRSA